MKHGPFWKAISEQFALSQIPGSVAGKKNCRGLGKLLGVAFAVKSCVCVCGSFIMTEITFHMLAVVSAFKVKTKKHLARSSVELPGHLVDFTESSSYLKT